MCCGDRLNRQPQAVIQVSPLDSVALDLSGVAGEFEFLTLHQRGSVKTTFLELFSRSAGTGIVAANLLERVCERTGGKVTEPFIPVII